ncbi:MAG: glutamate decarboxylase [Eubacteriales bacterium]
MWTVIYIAQNKRLAEKYKKNLSEEGLLVQLRAIGTSEHENVSVEILVPESEVEEAHEILTDIIGR